MSKPKVSIVTLTYNHGLFIKSALDSFINQNTDFDYEVIVSDDASQDNTQSIIMDYAKRYPNIIKPIIHKHNIGAVPNLVNALNHVKGEYLALCDGDDFWTDNSKLQKQVNFLDDNSDYSLCFHNVRIFFQDEKISDEIYPNMKSDDEITLENLIKNNFIPTNSVMYRSRVYKNIPVDILPPDWYLHLYHAKNGKIGYMPSIMAAYRRHSGGIWWDSINWPDELWIKYGNMHQRFYLELKKLFKTDKSAILSVNESLAKYLIQLADIDRRKGTKLFANAVKIDPSTVETTLQYAYEQNIKFEKYWIDSTTYIKTLIEDKESVSQELHVTKKKNEELQQQISLIQKSRLWKLRTIVRENKIHKKRLLKIESNKTTDYQIKFHAFKDPAKPHLLVTMPWMTFGGAETLTYNYCKEIVEDINITFMTGLQSENEWEYKFKNISQNIYHLPKILSDSSKYLDFVSDYIVKNSVDILHIVHNGFMFDMLPELKKRNPKLKIALTLFNDRVPEYVSGAINYQKQIDSYVTDNNKVSISLSKQLAPKTKITVIPNGIDAHNVFNPELFNRTDVRKKLEINDDELAVFFIGRLSEEKNPNVFVEAAQQCTKHYKGNNIKFFVVGDGSMREEIEKMISINKPSNITYLGYQEDVAKYLSAADVFILPSSIEGFPLSLLEAMAMNVVPIASDVGAVSDVISSEVDGYVVSPGSVKEISEKIMVLAKDNKKLNTMKKLVRKKVEQKYSSRILGTNYKNLYEEIMK